MKIKSYHILFRLLSYLSDKTNGAPFFVKYKLLLGTLIISVASSSANTLSKIKPANDSIPLNEQAEITCYKPAINLNVKPEESKKIICKGSVQNEQGEWLPGVTLTIKGKESFGTYTDIDGIFTLEAAKTDVAVFSYIGCDTQEVPVSEIIKINRPIIMKESSQILCYEVVIVRSYKDDIYSHSPKRISKLPYYNVENRPVSPVGTLYEFKDWMNENVRYNETMLKDKIQGNVILSFAIDKDGKITNKKVIGKLSPEADAEALRVLSSSKKWTPGEHRGKKIKTTLTIEVSFKMPQ